jgi:ribosomal protein S18 acetylase RimI-like enzyme
MHAALATDADVGSWLELVREVEPLFGPMPDFEGVLLRKIGQRAAFCVRPDLVGSPRVLGGMLIGGAPMDGWIRWIAVRSSGRGRGVGRCLLEKAIEHFPPPATVSLDTFREENREGRPARRLYERMGFQPGPLVLVEGRPRQRYILNQTNRIA